MQIGPGKGPVATALALRASLAAPAALAQTVGYTPPEGAAIVHRSIAPRMLTFQNQGANDRICFSGIMAGRCGTSAILCGLNGDPPEVPFPMKACCREFRDPNVMQHIGEAGYPFFIEVPKESARKVTVRTVHEDGKTADFVSERAKNLIP